MIWANQTNQIQDCVILIIIVFLSLWIKKEIMSVSINKTRMVIYTQQPIDSGNDDQMQEEIDHQNEQFQQPIDSGNDDQNDDIIIVNEID